MGTLALNLRKWYHHFLYFKVHGMWSSWSSSSSNCSVTCGGGEIFLTRTCTNPSPKYNGLDCQGNATQYPPLPCNEEKCVGSGKITILFSEKTNAPGYVWHLRKLFYQEKLCLECIFQSGSWYHYFECFVHFVHNVS